MKERNYQIIIGILVLIIVAGGWYFVARKGSESGEMGTGATSTTETTETSEQGAGAAADQSSSAAATDSTTGSSATTNTTVASGDAVTVSDQTAGMSVAVKSVSFSQAGWVAVKDSNGRILGAGWFPAGTQSDVEVPLLRATAAGEHYQVLLYADDGDKAFDFHKDTLITNSDGSVAGTNFTAN